MRDVEVPHWLSALPHAPEFRPTDTEFADPIAYISKIEKEASAYGICKIIPPLPRPSKKYVFSNLNKSLLKSPDLGSDVDASKASSSENKAEVRAVFTTRQQELGHIVKKGKGAIQELQTLVNKQVWQSGEVYTLDQFESKAKAFAKSTLGVVKDVSPLVVEAMFWKANSGKPIYVEYANDVPGSGFGQPCGNMSFQYFHRRRPKRGFRKTRQLTPKKYEINSAPSSVSRSQENYDSCEPSIVVNTHADTPSIASEKNASPCQQEKSDVITDIEGTAGWKLSNSPWNLQVIARSPGSLTRFMPDDIPGVTSPMVYIGMLFSWFAWHIEDHELHSLNFLHTGSSKTWYSVPGDYAFAFEEVIRTQAYGENIDRLAALTMLGEKTTLLSPDVVVASAIPCCRLVQNPGEFVVTFPRAYHVGFSHGFNCGEAANFGTPQWLKVAKDAAVRRAAMSFLPMLSHQQLLYLLTMSFVSRVPRALIFGGRSSRLQDRMKEGRELSVKRAFIEDILNENKLLSVLCGDKSTHRAVLWDPEFLPSSSKDTSMENTIVKIGESSNSFHSGGEQDLLAEMSLYMETVKNHYADDDDFLSDFQVDYGTVACVGCGILGFPFMTVVQPSKRACLSFKTADQNLSAVEEGSSNDGSSEHLTSDCDDPVIPLMTKVNNEWNASSRFFRPRVFCLEHAIQLKELLEPKGGVEVLVICHSDFQKIKAHAAAVADDIGSRYSYDMVPLDSASMEDLNLIDLAIDEDKEGGVEDWTSILGINLRHCIRTRKNSSSKRVDHALKLFEFSSNTTLGSSLSSLKWQHTRSRSKNMLPHEDEQKAKVVRSMIRAEKKIVQYSRRKSRLESVGSEPLRNTAVDCEKVSASIFTDIRGRDSPLVDTTCSNTADKNSDKACFLRQICVSKRDGFENDNGVHLIGGVVEGTLSCALEQLDSSSSPVRTVESSAGTWVNTCTNTTCLEKSSESECCQHIGVQIESMKVAPSLVASISFATSTVIENPCTDVFLDTVKIQTMERRRENSLVFQLLANMSAAENHLTLVDNKLRQDVQLASGNSEERVLQIGKTSAGVGSEVRDVICVKANYCNASTSENVRNTDLNAEKACELPDKNYVVYDSRTEREEMPVPKGPDSYDGINSNQGIPANVVDQSVMGRFSPDASPGGGELENNGAKVPQQNLSSSKSRKRNRELDHLRGENCLAADFIRSPCEGLRPRSKKAFSGYETDPGVEEATNTKKSKHMPADTSTSTPDRCNKKKLNSSCRCDVEGCKLFFKTKAELRLHQQNQCHFQSCLKKFTCHRYLIVHQRVHDQSRPLKCSWEGCNMTFKWLWARTEHLRVHTGERPYKCKAEDCGLRFRFISDFSRHRRKTGHGGR